MRSRDYGRARSPTSSCRPSTSASATCSPPASPRPASSCCAASAPLLQCVDISAVSDLSRPTSASGSTRGSAWRPFRCRLSTATASTSAWCASASPRRTGRRLVAALGRLAKLYGPIDRRRATGPHATSAACGTILGAGAVASSPAGVADAFVPLLPGLQYLGRRRLLFRMPLITALCYA